MAGMLQIITYLLATYLVFKGVEILQIALASERKDKAGIVTIGWLMLAIAIVAAGGFATMQDNQAQSISRSTSQFDY